MGSFFVWVSAEGLILGAFRGPRGHSRAVLGLRMLASARRSCRWGGVRWTWGWRGAGGEVSWAVIDAGGVVEE